MWSHDCCYPSGTLRDYIIVKLWRIRSATETAKGPSSAIYTIQLSQMASVLGVALPSLSRCVVPIFSYAELPLKLHSRAAYRKGCLWLLSITK